LDSEWHKTIDAKQFEKYGHIYYNLESQASFITKKMDSAPRDRKILVFNLFCGWYITKYDDKRRAWPMYADNRNGGVWFPVPSHWMELPDSPAENI
jgi:hypothetical protein